jgi:hypothetical protein
MTVALGAPHPYIPPSGHRLRRISWGWVYRTHVLVPLANKRYRVCDVTPTFTHPTGHRDMGCAWCAESPAPAPLTLADAIKHVDESCADLVACGFYGPDDLTHVTQRERAEDAATPSPRGQPRCAALRGPATTSP